MNLPELLYKTNLRTTLPKSNKTINTSEYILQSKEQIEFSFLGIDPGLTHIGTALYVANPLHTFYAWEILKDREITTEERIHVFIELLHYVSGGENIKYITIEGASYMDRYRQVELEDIRAACVCWKKEPTILNIVPPLTIRKTVFGSGKIKNPWKEQGLPDNAAAALGCALYPIFKGENDKS